jgi:H+/Cl- antiporter ClcA
MATDLTEELTSGPRLATYVAGGLVGGVVGGLIVVATISALKMMLDTVSAQDTWVIIVMPVIGLALASLLLNGVGRRVTAPVQGGRSRRSWRSWPPGAIPADITGDVQSCAGREERMPWRLAPMRLGAIFATVGSGAAMGTEAPAAYLATAAGAAVCDRGEKWRRLLRPAALGGGAAGVAALMAIPLVGTAYVLEIGRRNGAPYSLERVIAALIGGFVGWKINDALNLDLIRLVVPKVPPYSIREGAITALCIGVLAGAITALAAAAIYRAKDWRAHPAVRVAIGGLASIGAALLLVRVAGPSAAVGPGGGAIVWAESVDALPLTLLAVALLRAAITTAATAAGGCGGVFVPFLATGDIGGRVFAPILGIGNDLAGAAGAAAGIAGGYHLPLTAIAMVLGVGGPRLSTLTCLATVLVAWLVGIGVATGVDRIERAWRRRRRTTD